ncbi:butyrophilin-like protein 10 [Oreochromis niloticus]|uniref:butyrophilin-like protein 10 n=1 Tax=Oreochromis niloticus TaxID=8128 RepID=UPI000DF20252|nr:butyrophilin-like protein 10 [Oreochromis niloticus]
MTSDDLETLDFSLTLRNPQSTDSGTYTISIQNERKVLKLTDIQLHIKVYKVEADSKVESVLLPCKTTVCLPKDAKVEWKDENNRKVHVYENGSDQPEQQHQDYKGLTSMKRNLPGDLSLTLKYPTDGDTNTYTCTAYSREGNILIEKQVNLTVRVPQVEVDSGVESVQLPLKTTGNLPKDAKVEWKDGKRAVRMYDDHYRKVRMYDDHYRKVHMRTALTSLKNSTRFTETERR